MLSSRFGIKDRQARDDPYLPEFGYAPVVSVFMHSNRYTVASCPVLSFRSLRMQYERIPSSLWDNPPKGFSTSLVVECGCKCGMESDPEVPSKGPDPSLTLDFVAQTMPLPTSSCLLDLIAGVSYTGGVKLFTLFVYQGEAMPVYDYQCGKCSCRFSVTMLISEHGSKNTRCPKCRSSKVVQQISGFFAKTTKKS